MSVQVLLSAMHLADYKYIEKLNITGDVLVINQCDNNDRLRLEENGRIVDFLSTKDRGLSRSRNQAIREATGDICIFCDNDVVYITNYDKTIEDAFKRNADADIIVFFIERPERKAPIFDKSRALGYVGAMKIFSPEIAFRRKSILDNEMFMNENFGAGAKFMMGEENIFLFEAMGKGLKVVYEPIKIASLLDTQSTWFKGYNEQFFISRGAGYYAMSRKWHLLLIWQFAIRKYGLYKSDMSMIKAVKAMLKGVKIYKQDYAK